jgi:hypothetical protein
VLHPSRIGCVLALPAHQQFLDTTSQSTLDDFRRLRTHTVVLHQGQNAQAGQNCALVRLEETNVEHVVEAGARRQLELLGDHLHGFTDPEGPVELGPELASPLHRQ